ncbi:MAG: pilin [Candidatus Berkelbacteria bacterium]|nr:pilin [Candidatus Berkelbacteria bacterium]
MKKFLNKLAKTKIIWGFFPLPNRPDCKEWSCANIDDIENIIRVCLKGFIGFFGAIAVLMFVLGGYYYITAFDNEEQAQKAKKTITWAFIGLWVALLAWVIVTWVWDILAGGVPPNITPP